MIHKGYWNTEGMRQPPSHKLVMPRRGAAKAFRRLAKSPSAKLGSKGGAYEQKVPRIKKNRSIIRTRQPGEFAPMMPLNMS